MKVDVRACFLKHSTLVLLRHTTLQALLERCTGPVRKALLVFHIDPSPAL